MFYAGVARAFARLQQFAGRARGLMGWDLAREDNLLGPRMANHKVLLIDYEPKSIERIVRPLEGAGFAVETATDGLAGIEAFERIQPSLVIIEAMIPKKHGFEVCQEIKKSQRGKRTPVVITTAVYKGRKYRTQALHIYGCDEYVEKPIAEDALVALVRRLVGAGPEPVSISTKSDASVAAARETAPATRPAGGSGSAVKTAPKATSVSAIVGDLTEQEIMDRLDALLPSDPFEGDDESLGSVISSLSKSGSAEAAAAPSLSLETLALEEEDDTAVASEDGVFHLPEDLADIPMSETSLSDALSEPEPAKPPVESAQVVSFEDVKSRRNRRAAPAEVPIPAKQPVAPPAPKVEARQETREPVAPRPVLVSDDNVTATVPRKSRGGAVWIGGAVVCVALLASAYMLWFRESDPAEAPVPATSVGEARPRPARPAPSPAVAEPAPAAIDPGPSTRQAAPASTGTPSGLPARARQAAAASASASPGSGPDAKPRAEEPRRDAVAAPKPAAVPPAAAAPARETKTSGQKPASATASPHLERKEAESPPQPDPGPESLALDPPPPPSLATGTLPASPKASAALTLIAEDADVAPVVVSRPLPTYTPKARALRHEGTVVFRLLIDESGKVVETQLVRGIAGSDLNDAALRAAKQWVYRPARKDGVPVKVWKVEEVTFKR
jgi:TonB family protein